MTLVDDLRNMMDLEDMLRKPDKIYAKIDEIERFIDALILTADQVEEMLIAEKMK